MRFTILTALILSVSLFSCNNAPKGEKVEAKDAQTINTPAEGETYMVDTEKSVLEWEATEPVGDGHNGSIRVKSGKLLVDGGMVTGGEFVVDMKTITVLDLEGKRKEKLEGHLSTGDFFESDTYPEAKFVIAKVTQDSANKMTITGNLTIKDITKSIEFPVNMYKQEGEIQAISEPFTIDRTEWNITYRSDAVGTVKDKIINNRIGFKVKIVAAADEM